MPRNLLLGILLVALTAGVDAIVEPLTTKDIQRATELARWPHTDAERAAFHKRYTLAAKGSYVEYFAVESIEVITPFRRLESIAEEHARINDLFARGGLQDAEDALRPWRDQVAIVAHLRYDLTKRILGVPPMDLTIEGAAIVSPVTVKSEDVYIYDRDQKWLSGGTIEAGFDVRAVGQATRPVVVRSNGKELARVAVAFGTLE